MKFFGVGLKIEWGGYELRYHFICVFDVGAEAKITLITVKDN